MHLNLVVSALAWVTTAGAPQQQDALSIFATVGERQAVRWDTVENYTVEQRMEGAPMSAPLYYEKHLVDGRTTFRLVPLAEWAGDGQAPPPPEFFEMYAWGLETIVDGHVAQGHPLGPAIKDMTGDMGTFLRAIADGQRSGVALESGIEDGSNVGGMAVFASRARFVRMEMVDGREAYLLEADGLSELTRTKQEGGGEFAIERMQVWIDASEYVLLRVEMSGEVSTDGQQAAVVFEISEQNYEQVGSLYVSQRRVMRISGLMEAMATDPKRREELEEMRREFAKSQEQLAEMEEQLAQLPEATRKMVEGQIEQAQRQMQMMANEGIIEAVTEMKIIGINEGPPVDWTPSFSTPGS